MNSYLDFNDFDTPVKSYVDDRATSYSLKSFTKYTKVFAKLNKATLNDDYFKLRSASTKEFFSTEKIQNDIGSIDTKVALQALILLDSSRGIYQRTVFSILDLTGTLGGIFGLLTSFCGTVVTLISTQIMLASVFRRLYFMKQDGCQLVEDKVIQRPENINNPFTEEEKEKEPDLRRQTNLFTRVDDSRVNSDISVQLDIQNKSVDSNTPNYQSYVNKLGNELKNRRRYKAS